MLGLGTIFYVALLLVNSIAILNEERFLSRIGWSTNPRSLSSLDAGDGDSGVKQRLIHLISAVRVLLRIPLIIINVLVIIYELILG
ncbi:integral membrane protein required for ER to golgi transport [Malassezia restricta]|uniref:Protein transport protein yos1 n=1 Tax=Malassezia restricta (strain ATCC 96810 / NBRC 103918 / CBS 7877) TaxID=425264 RepID=A0A3G2S784_MALR7|nr:integral membrane protein required for ER to golgi transport [Malassezia restricta]AXA49773.1 integral membrane protein required for ER to golgi transport [Malassezia restricta]AYO43028.1 Protein transport protein yos1 [Malassezia restricta CBS 7877]